MHKNSDRFRFYVSGSEDEVLPGTRLWEEPVSGKTSGSPSCPCPDSGLPEISIGEFLTAGAAFISKNDYAVLTAALAVFARKPVKSNEIDSVSLFLEKHGAFYHPVRGVVRLHGGCLFECVLNGAVSEPGLSLIESEFETLSRLGSSMGSRFLPRVFGLEMSRANGHSVGFFFGEWLSGYQEFHLTRQRGADEIVVWESDGSCRYLPFPRVLPVYREIARILTLFYDLESCEQVFPWHHGAGDFIFREDAGRFHVRLITARGYAALAGVEPSPENPAAHILPSLFLFFIHLTLRIRIDRLDGTGDLVFMDASILQHAAMGFTQALEEKSRQMDFGDIAGSFRSFFEYFDSEQLSAVAENILGSYHSEAPERDLITGNLASHCEDLALVFKRV